MKDLMDILHYCFPCSDIYIQEQPSPKHTNTNNMKLTLISSMTYLSLGTYVALITFVCLHWIQQIC